MLQILFIDGSEQLEGGGVDSDRIFRRFDVSVLDKRSGQGLCDLHKASGSSQVGL
jgi:hypothetical protein